MKKLIAVSICAAILAPFPSTAGAQEVSVMGQAPCGLWMRAKPPAGAAASTLRLGLEGWVLGFLSGTAFGTNAEFLEKEHPESLYLWMDNYCQANPLSDTAFGSSALAIELMKKQKARK